MASGRGRGLPYIHWAAMSRPFRAAPWQVFGPAEDARRVRHFRVSALSTSRADLSRKGNPIGCGKVLTGVRLNRGRWHSISTVSGLCLARAFLAIRQGQEVLFQPIMLLARFR
jgi:hypothetical protein